MFDGKDFGKRLRALRKQAGYSSAGFFAEDVAALNSACPETRSTIAKWEAGLQTKSLATLAGICETLNVSADKLLFDTNTTQLSIYQETGLTDPAINTLRALRAEDPSGRLMAALNRALSDPDILNALAAFMAIESDKRGFHTASSSPEGGFYTVEMSPDSYAQVILIHLNQRLEELRTGEKPAEYPPYTAYIKQMEDELRKAGRLIERSEDNAKEE